MVKNNICSVAECERKANAKQLCARHYGRKRRHGNPLGGRTQPGEPMRFLKEAVSTNTQDCIKWPFAKTHDGYGTLLFKGRKTVAHRASLSMFLGRDIEPNKIVAHTPVVCHNRLCVNPSHLRETDIQQNADDRILDGTKLFGEKNGRSKLTWQTVRDIRASDEDNASLAAKYGVSDFHISRIRRGLSWTKTP